MTEQEQHDLNLYYAIMDVVEKRIMDLDRQVKADYESNKNDENGRVVAYRWGITRGVAFAINAVFGGIDDMSKAMRDKTGIYLEKHDKEVRQEAIEMFFFDVATRIANTPNFCTTLKKHINTIIEKEFLKTKGE